MQDYDGRGRIGAAARAVLDRAPSLFIDGGFVAAAGTATLPVVDPADGRVVAHAADASDAEVDRAVRSADAAFRDGRWRNMRPADRERALLRLADLIEAHGDALAEVETIEQGKSINLSRAIEVGGSAEWTRYAAGLATKLTGRTLDVSLPGGPGRWTAYTRREPVGVVAGIVPWNFPLLIALWKVLPALAAGCSIVLKPSETTPLTALMLAELAVEAGVPAGVFNVVTGRGAGAGRALTGHPLVAKISFTGSTATGKVIGAAAVDGMKRFTLELGGKNPAVVLADADLSRVVPGLMAGGFLNGGQVCAAASRIYVEDAIHDDLVAALHGALGTVSVGPGLDPAAQLNPLASAVHRDKVVAYLDQARASGARVLAGAAVPDAGWYVSPALVLDPGRDARLSREEVFGPVLGIHRCADAEEAVARANDSDLGLAASLWTRDLDRAMTLTRRLEAGTVWVNAHVFIDPNMPFGGFKQSGIGRDFGPDWLAGYTEEKSVCIAH